MSCYCTGGPSCCARQGFVPDWTYYPVPVGPGTIQTTGTADIEITALSCLEGHAFVPKTFLPSGNVESVYCTRCAEVRVL